MSDRREDQLKCGVCLEEYEESGPHIPRLLPCTHTVCEWCLIQLLGGAGTLTCPECKAKHVAPSREKTFPQNRYLLTNIKRRVNERNKSEEESREKVKRCTDHGKELTLFCKKTQCQTLICSACTTRNHKKHDVVDVDENRKEELETSLTSAIESILSMVRDKYDSMIQEAENQKEESRSKMAPIEESLVVLTNIKQNFNRENLMETSEELSRNSGHYNRT